MLLVVGGSVFLIVGGSVLLVVGGSVLLVVGGSMLLVVGGSALLVQRRGSLFCFGHLSSCHIFYMPQAFKSTIRLLVTGW